MVLRPHEQLITWLGLPEMEPFGMIPLRLAVEVERLLVVCRDVAGLTPEVSFAPLEAA
jgi:hypothetical protein